MHRVTVNYGRVIDGHVAARFYLDVGYGRRAIGTLLIPHDLVWVIDHMIESADNAAELEAILEAHAQRVAYKITDR